MFYMQHIQRSQIYTHTFWCTQTHIQNNMRIQTQMLRRDFFFLAVGRSELLQVISFFPVKTIGQMLDRRILDNRERERMMLLWSTGWLTTLSLWPLSATLSTLFNISPLFSFSEHLWLHFLLCYSPHYLFLHTYICFFFPFLLLNSEVTLACNCI